MTRQRIAGRQARLLLLRGGRGGRGGAWEVLGAMPANYYLEDMATDGTLLARGGQRLFQSIDRGGTWTPLVYDLPSNEFFPAQVGWARVAGDGGIVVGLVNDDVYRSNTAAWDSGFSSVLSVTTGMQPRRTYGTFVYRNIFCLGEYGVPEATEGYLSKDNGYTWSNFFTLPAASDAEANNHIHAIVYDPYDELYWVCAGDQGNRNIYYSDDEGTVWTPIGDSGELVNFIQAVPMPDRIVFLTDSDEPGAYAFERGAAYTVANLSQVWIAEDGPVPGGIPIASRPVVQYDGDACYVSFEYFDASLAVLGAVYRTLDGLNYTKVAQSPNAPTGTLPFGSPIWLGPVDGYLYGEFDRGGANLDADRYLVRVREPQVTARDVIEERLLSLFNDAIVALWMQDETSGTAADDAGANNCDGVYADVSLADAVAQWGLPMPRYNGETSVMKPYSAALEAAFSGAAGSLIVPAQMAPGAWSDGAQRGLARFSYDDSNRVQIMKTGTENQLYFNYRAAGTDKAVTDTSLAGTSDMFLASLTWDASAGASGEVKAYLNDAQVGATQTGLGTWAGATLNSNQCAVGAQIASPTNLHNGWLGPTIVLNRAATLAEIQSVCEILSIT